MVASNQHEHRPKRIAVVDDSTAILRVVDRVLSERGYEVWTTDDSHQSVSLIREAAPDLVLIDFAMPGVNGFELCRMLGEEKDLEDIPIVIMSTRGDPIGERFVRNMGIIDHIRKPFAPEALIALVEHALMRSANPRSHWSLPRSESTTDALRAFGEHIATITGTSADTLIAALAEASSSTTWVKKARHWLASVDGAPAFGGDLAQCGLSEVLQLLAMQRQTGCLIVRRLSATAEVWFQDGRVRLVTGLGIPEEHMLGTILVRRGHMTHAALQELVSTRHSARRRLGAHAVKLGHLKQSQLEAAMHEQSSELVYEMLRFGTGSFMFDRRALPDSVLEFQFELTVDELLLEGFRRVDEWGLIEAAIPSFDSIPRVVSTETKNLSASEQTLLAVIDGGRTIRQIIDRTAFGTFEGARILFRLISIRVVKLTTPLESEAY